MGQDTSMPTWVVWIPILSALVSGVFAFVGGVVAQVMTMGRERRLRDRQFQIDTIVELQDTLNDIHQEFLAWKKGLVVMGNTAPDAPGRAGTLRIISLMSRLKDRAAYRAVVPYVDKYNECISYYLEISKGSREVILNDGESQELAPLLSRGLHALGDTLRNLL